MSLLHWLERVFFLLLRAELIVNRLTFSGADEGPRPGRSDPPPRPPNPTYIRIIMMS